MEIIKIEKLKKMGIRKKHYHSDINKFICNNKDDEKRLQILKKIILNKENKNVVIFSTKPGFGKTMLCSAAVIKYSGIYKTWEEIIDDIKISRSFNTKKTTKDVLNDLFTVNFLAIDDINCGDDDVFKKNTLSRILKERFENEVPTWIAGTFKASWLENNISPSAFNCLVNSGISFLINHEENKNR